MVQPSMQFNWVICSTLGNSRIWAIVTCPAAEPANPCTVRFQVVASNSRQDRHHRLTLGLCPPQTAQRWGARWLLLKYASATLSFF